MLKQPERESRNVNDFFYRDGGQTDTKNEQGIGRSGTDKSREEKTLIWLAGWEESTVDHLLSVIGEETGYGQIKRADTPINLNVSPRKMILC